MQQRQTLPDPNLPIVISSYESSDVFPEPKPQPQPPVFNVIDSSDSDLPDT